MQAQLPATAEGLEQSRLVTRATMYGVGFTNVFDTYLSPQEYTGIDFRVSRESMRMTRWMDGRLSLQSFFQADLGYTRNKADNNNTFSALANWNYGLHYNFPITGNFKLLAGGLADLNGGFVYNLRNTNNPASARAYINLDVSGMAIWNLRIKNYPLTQEKLALEAEMSVTYLRRIEHGRANPTLRALDRVAAILGMELSTLLQLSEGGQKSREESRALCDGEEARHA